MLLVVIESDEVFVFGVICLCRYSKCILSEFEEYLRYSQMPYLVVIGSHGQRAYVPGSRTDSRQEGGGVYAIYYIQLNLGKHMTPFA